MFIEFPPELTHPVNKIATAPAMTAVLRFHPFVMTFPPVFFVLMFSKSILERDCVEVVSICSKKRLDQLFKKNGQTLSELCEHLEMTHLAHAKFPHKVIFSVPIYR